MPLNHIIALPPQLLLLGHTGKAPRLTRPPEAIPGALSRSKVHGKTRPTSLDFTPIHLTGNKSTSQTRESFEQLSNRMRSRHSRLGIQMSTCQMAKGAPQSMTILASRYAFQGSGRQLFPSVSAALMARGKGASGRQNLTSVGIALHLSLPMLIRIVNDLPQTTVLAKQLGALNW